MADFPHILDIPKGIDTIASYDETNIANIDITNIPDKYLYLILSVQLAIPLNNLVQLGVRFSNDNGSTFVSAANYNAVGVSVAMAGLGAGVAHQDARGYTYFPLAGVDTVYNAANSGLGVSGNIYIHNYDTANSDSIRLTSDFACMGINEHTALQAIAQIKMAGELNINGMDALQLIASAGNITAQGKLYGAF